MTDCNPPQTSLHAPTHREPHVDSEEAVQYERRRVSQELEPIYQYQSSTPSSEQPRASQAAPSFASHGSRNASSRSPIASHEYVQCHISSSSGAATQADIPSASEAGRQSSRSSVKAPHWYDPVAKFWRTHISITIDDGAHRDHLALERTFLGYLRTSLILVMTSVLIAQLFRIQRTANPSPDLGFYVIGLPLSITFIGMAILVLLIGAYRFWKLQNGMMRGKAYAGGWEIVAIMALSALLLVVTFALVLGVNIDKALEDG